VYNGKKQWRPMPDPLDAMFVLGNNDALPLLKDTIQKYHYATQLGGLRYLVDAYTDSFWNKSLYNTWLHSIRSLNPDQDTSGMPFFMKTSAWRHEKLNTQLVSWSQLRHDNLLYAKQSYTGWVVCSYPHSYIEPYPELYERIGRFADRASGFISGFQSEKTYSLTSVTDYFSRLGALMDTFKIIANKELNRTPFNAEEIAFLQDMIEEHHNSTIGCGEPETYYTGWYDDLFYIGEDVSKQDYIVADVHTQPSDKMGMPVGNVMHVGTGKLNLGVFLAPSPSNDFDPVAFVGPVGSFYKEVTSNFHRMNDQEWSDSVMKGNVPERPEWVYSYIARKNGETQQTQRVLPYTTMFKSTTGKKEIAANRQSFNVFPNPAKTRVNFSFTADENEPVSIRIYNQMGALVKTLHPARVFQGNNVYTWFPPSDMNGVYFAKIKKNGQKMVAKMVIVSQ
jgi:hypothetical protein